MSRREPKESNDKSAHEVNCSGDFRRMYYGSVVTAEGPTGEMLASQIHNLKYEAEQQRIVKSVVGPYPEPGIYNCEEHGLECKWCLLDYGSRAVPNSRSIIRGLSSVGLSGGMVDIDFTREFWSDPGNDNENSPMCISCTTERMLILGCPAHIMYPLNWRTIQMEGPVGFGRPEEYTWCSICLEPAKFVCDTENFSDKLGCGFALCCSCFNKFEDAQCIMVRFFDGLLTDCDMTLRGDASHLWDFGPVSRALMSEN